MKKNQIMKMVGKNILEKNNDINKELNENKQIPFQQKINDIINNNPNLISTQQ